MKEAARRYHLEPAGETTMSSKRQITIPSAIARELKLEPGAKFIVYVEDGEIVLKPRPKSWLEYVTSGPPMYTKNRTKEEVDEYIRWVREGWDERARRFEGDFYVETDD